MSNFKFLLSDPSFAPFMEVAMAAESALSVSPLGCHLSQRERQGGRMLDTALGSPAGGAGTAEP